MNYLLTGATRGLGLELARQLTTRGENVWCGFRQASSSSALNALKNKYPDQVHPIQIDVTDVGQVRNASAAIKDQADHLDVIFNNAGIFPRGESLETLNEKTLLDTFITNAIGPMSVVREMLPLLTASLSAKIINISSQLGSLERKTGGGDYSYCSSKAALNMLSRALAADLRSRGIPVIVVHPGWVQTDMGGSSASLTPQQSAASIIKLLDRITIVDTGKFFNWEGQSHPW